MSRAMLARIRRIEQLVNPPVWIPPKPWLVLGAGKPVPDPLPDEYGGVVQIVVFDGRRTHDHKSDGR